MKKFFKKFSVLALSGMLLVPSFGTASASGQLTKAEKVEQKKSSAISYEQAKKKYLEKTNDQKTNAGVNKTNQNLKPSEKPRKSTIKDDSTSTNQNKSTSSKGTKPTDKYKSTSTNTNKDNINNKNKTKKKFVEGEVLVKFKTNTSSDKLKTKYSLKLKKRLKNGTELLQIKSGASVENIAKSLKSEKSIEYAQPNYLYYPDSIPNDPKFDQLWGLHNTGQPIQGVSGTDNIDIDFPEALNSLPSNLSQTVVAVIDTGIDINHPDIKDHIWVNSKEIPNNNIDDDGNGYIDDVNGWDFYHYDNSVYDAYDFEDHGTHVSGTIAGTMDNQLGITGIAPNVKIMPLKFIGPNGGDTVGAIEAINYASKMGAQLSNNSWGGGGNDFALQQAIQDSNMLFVAAAGNDGMNSDSIPSYPSSYDNENIISVAALTNNGYLAPFSNYGYNSVDIAAPGTDILSTVPKKAEVGAAAQIETTSYKAIYNGFGYEHITGTQQRDDAFNQAMSFLGATTDSSILLVQDDGASQGYKNYLQTYKDLLTQAGLTYDVQTLGNGNGPSQDILNSHKIVIWFTGDNFETVLEPTDQTNLSNYLTQGGKLLLSGQDILYTSEQSDLVLNKLYLNFLAEGDSRNVAGVAGTIYDSKNYSLNTIPFADYVSSNNPDTTKINLVYPKDSDYTNAYAYFDGTSMATPHVTGVAALLLGKNPGLSPTEAKSIILNSGKPLDSLQGMVKSGKLLNANNALNFNLADLDNDIPGVPLKGDSITGNLNVTSDKDDVYSVYLEPGETIKATLTATDPTTDFDLYLFSPSANTVNNSSEMVAYSENEGSNESITYTADRPGTYYIDAFAYQGNGDYKLDIVKGNGPGEYEDTHSALNFWSNWSTLESTNYSGRSIKQINTHGGVDFSFIGSDFEWIATKDRNQGMATVYIDGQKQDVSLYSATAMNQQSVFKVSDLEYGKHRVNISWTGVKDPAGRKSGTAINVDKFIITDLKVAPKPPAWFNKFYDSFNKTINFNWEFKPGALGYNIYRKASTDTDFVKLNTTLLTDTNYKDSTAKFGETYKYYITTVGYGNLESSPSSTITYTMDDDIPGAKMNNLAASGTFDNTNYMDVWNVDLQAGSSYSFKFTNSDTYNFNYQIYGPDVTEVYGTTPPLYNIGDYQATEQYITITPKVSGTYYIAANGYSNAPTNENSIGTYSIQGTKLPEIKNTDIATAVSLDTALKATGNLDNYTRDNVYSINLDKGDTLTASLKPLSLNKNDFDLYLYPPSATTLDLSSTGYINEVAASNTAGTSTEKIVYTATETGKFYIDVNQLMGSGPYELNLSINKGTQATVTTIEENDPSITYSGTWATTTSSSHSGGTAKYNTTGGSAQYTFNGTGIKVLAYTANNRGKADIYIDGTLAKTVDLYSSSLTYQAPIFEVNNLVNGSHTIKIVNKGEKSSASSGTLISLDAFVITVPITTQNVTIEENDPKITYSGTWATTTSSSHSGGTAKYNTTGGSAQYTFNGTGIKVLAYTADNRGKADIYIDGTLAKTVDLYSSSVTYQVPIFEVNNLVNGSHTIKIVNKGEKSSVSSGTLISLDAFVITVPITTQNVTIEENDPKITYSGTWVTITSSSHSGGTAKYNTTGGSAQYTFNGTGIKALAYTADNRGKADIYIDGTLAKTVDLYSSSLTYQVPIFEVNNLVNGSHTIKIVNKGEKSSVSSGTIISLDSFLIY